MKVDLHLHTTYSDGVLSPAEILTIKKQAGIEAAAITDHDTVSGVDEAIEAGRKLGIQVISGIELSTYGRFEVHILGYNFNHKNPDFLATLSEISALRKKRVQTVLEKLAKIGVAPDTTGIDFEDRNLGRAHIARLMVAQGMVKSVPEAFSKYLGKGAPAHVEGMRFAPLEAVKLIKSAGGIAVLAHPSKVESNVEALIEGLQRYGLDGIECYYAPQNELDTAKFLKIAKERNLIATCGSDFHDDKTYQSPNFDFGRMSAAHLKKLGIYSD